MSKGDKLGDLLNEGDNIHAQMRQLFIKNNIENLDLKLLPEADKKEWYRLKIIADNLSTEMCELINPKKDPS
jgi:hypothetical protein